MISVSKIKVLKYRIWQITHAPFFLVKNYLPFWKFRNRKEFEHYRPPTLLPRDQKILRSLEQNGIAISNLAEFFSDNDGVLKKLLKTADGLINQELIQTETKEFLRYFFRTDTHIVSLRHPFVQTAIFGPFLNIISAYLKTPAHLEYITGNIALPVNEKTNPKASQKWHRDPGVYKMAKIFIYLSDVNSKSGPFTLIRGTQPGGKLKNICEHPFFGEGSYYPRESKINRDLKDEGVKKQIFEATGKSGTVVFANTLALHKGGYAIKNARKMLTFYYRPVRRGAPLTEKLTGIPSKKLLPSFLQEALSLR